MTNCKTIIPYRVATFSPTKYLSNRPLVLSLLILWTGNVSAKENPKRDFSQWEPAIKAFEQQNAQSLPPHGGILFVGSSSIRFWDLPKYFPQLDCINRGFGGSHIIDSIHFADRIIIKHRPRTIVFYAGDNDIASGKSPEQVALDFRQLVALVHKNLPQTKMVFLAIKPSISRWHLAVPMHEANERVATYCSTHEQLAYVDTWTPMLGNDGQPRAELFVKDGLHLNHAGYQLWTKLIAPHIGLTKVPSSRKDCFWIDLFADDSLGGWTTDDGLPVTHGWRIENGILVHSGRSGNIVTKRHFGDFELVFQWKISPGTNSGIKYRMKDYANHRLGCEYQLIDDDGYHYPLALWQRTGSIYGLYPPLRNIKPKPPGQWNTSRIIATGHHIEHWLGGNKIATADTDSDDWMRRVLRSKFNETPDFGQNGRGPIMIQDHGGTVWFRKMKIR